MAIRSTLPARLAGVSLVLTLAAATSAGADCGMTGVEAATCASIVGFGPDSVALQISADGHTAVGYVGDFPARWVDGISQPLGPMPPEMLYGGPATVASSDGSQIFGYGFIAGPPYDRWVAFGWKPESGIQLLNLPGTAVVTSASEDGRVIGGALDLGWNQAARWNDGVLEFLGSPAMGSGVTVYGLSADGSVAVGIGLYHSDFPYHAMRWGPSGPVDLMAAWPSHNSASGAAWGVSPDGSIAVGYASRPETAGQDRAVRWDGTVASFLDVSGFVAANARDLSADGARIVGEGRQGGYIGGVYTAVLWDEDGPLDVLADRLGAEGVDLDGWHLSSLLAVSDDGRTMAGNGQHDGVDQGFVAVLSPTVGLDIMPGRTDNTLGLTPKVRTLVVLYGSASLDVATLDLAQLGFGPAAAPVVLAFPPLDLNGDGFLDRHLYFEPAASGLAVGDTSACVKAPGVDGFRVCSPVTVVPSACGRGFGVALLLPPILLLRRRRR